MSNTRKLQVPANRQRANETTPLKANHRIMCDHPYAEAYNSKNNKRSRTHRFMHWFQKRFFCTSQQIPDNLEENIVKLPQISVPTNTATALHKLNDQLISNSVVPSIESSNRDISSRGTINDRTRTSRSSSIDINQSAKSLTKSTFDKSSIIRIAYPESKTAKDRISQTQLVPIHQLENNSTSSKISSESPRKTLPGITPSKSLPGKSDFSTIDRNKYRSIQGLTNLPECLKKPTSVARSLEVKSTRIEQTNEPQIHASQSVSQRPSEIPTNFIPGRCGLENLGNTCFMNSALQCMSNVSDLTKHIITHGLTSSINKNNSLGTGGEVATAYQSLIEEMWSGNVQSVRPLSLKKCVSKLFPRFSGYGQQDSHEFLNALLDALHEDLKRDSPNSDETSLISGIFHGQIRTIVTCNECKKPFYSYDSISFLALPIPDTPQESYRQNQSGKKIRSSVNLTDCLDLFLQPENLNGDNQWFCEECNHLTDAERILDLWTLPNILIIQLKRFSYDLSNNNKIEIFIDYPIRSLCLTDKSHNQAEHLYDLIAVSAHTGSLVGGHYTAYAKNFNNQQWYHFNDGTVRNVEENAALTGNAYILVYCKR